MHITIYSTSTCSACHTLGSWLDKQAIAYDKKVTDEDPSAMAEFLSVNDGNFGVPFTVIDTDDGGQTKIIGYDLKAFKQTLSL